MARTKVYLGIPSTGTRHDLQTYFLRNIEKKYGEKVEFVYPEKCIHRSFHDFARNSIVDEFLASDCEILWFLDSDVVPPEHVVELITEHGDKWQAAGAVYPIWMVPPGGKETCVIFTSYDGLVETPEGVVSGIKMTSVPRDGQKFIDGLATGCLMLKRSVFDELKKPYFEFKYNTETRQMKEGEDLGFCIKLNRLGIKFFTDYSMVCKHYKTVCLLDVNNYATSWSNEKILDYDKEVRSKVTTAINAAEQMGYERGQRDSKPSVPSMLPYSKSGLILPSVYARSADSQSK